MARILLSMPVSTASKPRQHVERDQTATAFPPHAYLRKTGQATPTMVMVMVRKALSLHPT